MLDLLAAYFTRSTNGPRGDRGWGHASGLLFVLGGAVVLIYPEGSLVTLIWPMGIVLLVTGVVLIAHGLSPGAQHDRRLPPPRLSLDPRTNEVG